MINWADTRVIINRLGSVRCEPGWRLDWNSPDFLDDFDLWFVRSGEGEMRIEKQSVPLHAGVCFWMRPGYRYHGTQNPQNRLAVTYIHFELKCHAGRMGTLPGQAHEVQDFQFFDTATRRIVELMRNVEQDAAPGRLEAEELLRAVLIGLDAAGEKAGDPPSHARSEHHRRIRGIASELLENCGDVPPVAELARRAGYSPVHFSRVFKKITGALPREFVIQARVERAKQLLRESSLSIGEISDALGYTDVYFFSRQFKHRSGLSPTKFRASR